MRKELLIVDGYNIIGAWPHLVKLKNQDKMEDARDSLLHELSNYQKYTGIKVRVVFDAQFVPGIQQSYEKYQLTDEVKSFDMIDVNMTKTTPTEFAGFYHVEQVTKYWGTGENGMYTSESVHDAEYYARNVTWEEMDNKSNDGDEWYTDKEGRFVDYKLLKEGKYYYKYPDVGGNKCLLMLKDGDVERLLAIYIYDPNNNRRILSKTDFVNNYIFTTTQYIYNNNKCIKETIVTNSGSDSIYTIKDTVYDDVHWTSLTTECRINPDGEKYVRKIETQWTLGFLSKLFDVEKNDKGQVIRINKYDYDNDKNKIVLNRYVNEYQF